MLLEIKFTLTEIKEYIEKNINLNPFFFTAGCQENILTY